MKTKICIIIVYMGQLPDFFKVWKQSAFNNQDIDFIVYNDYCTEKQEKNIAYRPMSLSELNERVHSLIGTEFTITEPYKIADYKPAYGMLFEDDIKKYDFWGFCDCDLIFGNIRSFMTEEILNQYDVINNRGHFRLFRNAPYYNTLFMKKSDGLYYRDALLCNETLQFDEHRGLNHIINTENVKCYVNNKSIADICEKTRFFVEWDFKNNGIFQTYFWSETGLFRYINAHKEPLLYLHMQKRKMNISQFSEKKGGVYEINDSRIMGVSRMFKKQYFRSLSSLIKLVLIKMRKKSRVAW